MANVAALAAGFMWLGQFGLAICMEVGILNCMDERLVSTIGLRFN